MKYSTFLILSLMLFSCGTTTKTNNDDILIKEAASYHMQALEVEKEFKSLAKTLENKANGIQIQGRGLTEPEMKWLKEYQDMMRGYELWEENHIEVPGHDHHHHDHSHEGHDHDHHHHHHHHHENDVKLTPQDMMETQKAFLDNINDLKKMALALGK